VEQRKQGRGWNGHFLGFWARLNCEEMPVIPAWLVRSNLYDPRRIPYLLVWKDDRHGGEIKEAVRLTCCVAHDSWGHVELKRTDGSTTVLSIVWRMLPRNGGRSLLLLCPYCNTPRRHVYGWEWDSFSGWSNRVRSISWRCRSCAQLRYSSEGGYLRPTGLGRLGRLGVILAAYGNLPRPESWLPYVFTSPEEAAEAGVCELSSVSWYAGRISKKRCGNLR
jgi:hypothetical protein